MRINPMFLCDAYKLDHMSQYQAGTTQVYSNFTARSFKYLNDYCHTEKMVFFGLQGVLHEMQDLWNAEFFSKNIEGLLAEFRSELGHFVSPAWPGYEKFTALHKLGYLPLTIKALPEGARVKAGIPVFTIENNEPEFFWLTNFIETYLSAELWKMSTNATIAAHYKELFSSAATKTGAPLEFTVWQGHDFSFRGMDSSYGAAKSGAAHLLSFFGTDTLPAVKYLNRYYKGTDTFIGGSVPATEHSVMCAGGKATELDTYRRLITELYPSGVVSIVSDTWDFWNVITNFARVLKPEILARQPDAIGLCKVVFRPDSGDPTKIICGDKDARPGSPEYKGAVECLWEIYGGTVSDKGYKMLDSHVGLIYGDSITPMRCKEILEGLEAKGFASSNIVVGIGSFSYQYNTRDTLGFAMKATNVVVNGEEVAIFKDPATDTLKIKKSAKGRLAVLLDANGEYILMDQVHGEVPDDQLKIVFRSKPFPQETLAGIRARLG